MFKLDCSSCGENFIRMADLRKHTLLQHYEGTGQQGVKRKSIFDGIEMDKRNSKEARRSFLLVFLTKRRDGVLYVLFIIRQGVAKS